MKATIYEMICTNNITGAKMKCTVTIEGVGGDAEAIGEVQNNFLWKTFDFEMNELATIELPEGTPLTTYGNTEAI